MRDRTTPRDHSQQRDPPMEVVEAAANLQETLLRAWRGWSGFRRGSSVRAWLYRIATNVCPDHLARRRRRVLPYDPSGPANGPAEVPPVSKGPWLEPIPSEFLAPGSGDDDPYAPVVRKETVELAFS